MPKRSKTLAEFSQMLGQSESQLGDEGSVEITGLSHSSAAVKEGDLFFAIPGARVHGAMFALDAKNRGARAILTDKAGDHFDVGLPKLVVGDPRRMAGVLSAWFYEEPLRDMFSVGVTGTNGKTTTTTLLQQLWTGARRTAGLIGTVETRIGEIIQESKRTTPESSELQRLASQMRSKGVTHFVMEVSSHALTLERVRGSHFSSVAFTNLTQDHLDFHRTMDEYYQAKARLFTFEFAEKAFINIDNTYGQRLANETELPVLRLSGNDTSADWYFQSFHIEDEGMAVSIRGVGGVLIEGFLPLHGDFNLDNALMAIALAFDSGLDPVEISSLLPSLVGAQGRLEPVNAGQDFLAFVDYAHSPDAVMRVLTTCRALTNGRLIAVLGCGGDRDPSKRILMGRALHSLSDISVFTSDNPRSENPVEILREMTSGLDITNPSQIIVDRGSAIHYAISCASPKDLVVILGKGHEVGQEISGEIFSFDDRKVLRQAIENRS